MRFTKILVILLAILTIFGCRKDIDGETTQVFIQPNVPILEDSGFSGLIIDEQGNPIEDAVVDFTSFSQSSDENGYFHFENISLNQAGSLINIDKDGYYKGYKFIFPEKSNQTYLKVMLIEKKPKGEFNAVAGGQVEIENASLNFTANSIIDELTKQDYNGTVEVYFHWYDTEDSNTPLSMPGDLRAIDAENNLKALASFGMVAVELRGENNQKLNLKENTTATIRMAAPDVDNLPGTMPMWSLNEENAYWIEEGSCVLENGFYVGEVSHFSFWNCDAPYDLVNIKGTITNSEGEPISNAYIKIIIASSSISGSAHTNTQGEYSGKVPKGVDLNIIIYDECGNIAKEGALGNFIVDTNLPTLQIESEILTTTIIGNVLCNGNPLNAGYVKIDYSSGYTAVVEIRNDGSFEVTRLLCEFSGEEISVLAINDAQSLSSESTIFNLDQTGLLDVGTIDACTQELEEWISLTLDGVDKGRMYGVSAHYGKEGLVLATTDSLGTGIQFKLNDPQLTDQNPYLAAYIDGGPTYVCFTAGPFDECDGMIVNLEEISRQVDGVISGSYSGTLAEGLSGAENVEISGDFRILLDSYSPNAVVRGKIWHDENGNGLQDPDEGPPSTRYSIRLDQNDTRNIWGNPAGDFITHVAANESFSFFSSSFQWTQTIPNAGDDTLDSDFDLQGTTDLYNLGDGEYLDNIGLGLVKPESLDCWTNPSGEIFNCSGQEVEITVEVDDGTAPYQFLWNTGETAQTIYVFSEGTYTVTVSDALGVQCITEVSVYEEYLDITDPIITHAICGQENGSIDFNNIQDLQSIEWLDLGLVDFVLTDLAPGTYDYIATNFEGCTAFGQVIINNQVSFIGTQVWIDNPGGVENQFDAGDFGYEGMEVRLLDAATEEILESKFTTLTGYTTFTNEYFGEFIIEYVLTDNDNYEFIEKTEEIEEIEGSDVDPLTGRTDTFNMVCGEVVIYIDAGLREL